MSEVINFPGSKAPAEPLVWYCACGCATFYLLPSGDVECAKCKVRHDHEGGAWCKAFPAEPEAAGEVPDGASRVVSLQGPDIALKRWAAHPNVDKITFAMIVFDDGTTAAFPLEALAPTSPHAANVASALRAFLHQIEGAANG